MQYHTFYHTFGTIWFQLCISLRFFNPRDDAYCIIWLKGVEKLNGEIIKQPMKYNGIKGYTLDIDATDIVAEKESAKMTYKGRKGYMPIVGHIAEDG